MREVLPDNREWRRALEAAASAPSILNTQPWLFELHRDRVELHGNADRQLRVLDRHGRQLLMSCGAALLNLRLALLNCSFEPDGTLLPERGKPMHVATVRIGHSGRTSGMPGSSLNARRPPERRAPQLPRSWCLR